MRKLLLILLSAYSLTAYSQSQPTSSKTRFVNGLYVGTKLDSYFAAADSNAIYWRADSALMAKYKGTARALAFSGDLAPYKLIADTFFTAGYTTRARTKQVIDSLAATELNISDTASMLSNYRRKTTLIENADLRNSAITINGSSTALGGSISVGTVTSVAASAGTGISVSGSPITGSGTLTITNTAPDQTVTLTAGTGISVSGTYPNFTVTNSSPSSGGTVTSVSAGTGMSFTTITSSGAVNADTTTLATRAYVVGLDVGKANTSLNNVNGVLSSTYGGAGSVSGILKANGSGVVSAAVAGTDYVAPSALSGYLPLAGGTMTTGADINLVGNDPANGMLTFRNTSNSSRVFRLSAGKPNLAQTGFSIFDVTANAIRFHITDAGAIEMGETTLSGALNGTSLSMSGGANLATSSGNVGIGTASPERKLHILGDMVVSGTSAGVYFKDNTNNPFVWVEDNYSLRFGTNNTERARLASDGTFLINTTTTDGVNKLIVNGGVKGTTGTFSSTITGTNGGLYLQNSAANSAVIGLIIEGTYPWQKYIDTESGQQSYGEYIDGGIFYAKTVPYADRNSAIASVGADIYTLNLSTGAATFSSTVAGSSFNAASRTLVYGGGVRDISGTGNDMGIAFGSSGLLSTNGNGTATVKDFGGSSTRWGTVYAQSGDFSSSVTASSLIKSGGTSTQALIADGSVISVATAATASTIVQRDGSGNINAGTGLFTSANSTTIRARSGSSSDFATISVGRTSGELIFASVAVDGQFLSNSVVADAIIKADNTSQNMLFGFGTGSSALRIVGSTNAATFSSSVYAQGYRFAYAAKSSNYTLTDTDDYINVTASCTITLPTAVGRSGKRYVIKCVGSVTATIASTSSQTIDGNTASTYTFGGPNFNIMIVYSDGSNWFTEAWQTGI